MHKDGVMTIKCPGVIKGDVIGMTNDIIKMIQSNYKGIITSITLIDNDNKVINSFKLTTHNCKCKAR